MSLQIRIQADDFFKAYHVLEKNSNSDTLAIMGPGIVCLSFSVELYLKDLHFALTEKAPRGHDVYKLFEKLPPQTRQEIFTHKSISQNPFMTRGNIFSTQYHSRDYSAYERFIDQMKTISDGFEKWRYSYEVGNLKYDSYFALALIEAVKSTANSIRQQKHVAFKNRASQ